MKKTLLAMAACAMMSASADAALYIVGEPAGEWNPAIGIEMEEADGGYTWTGMVADNQWFVFATQLEESGNWDVFNSTYRLNPPANGTVAAAGEYALTLGGKDCAFKGSGQEVTYFIKETNGAYTLTVTSDSSEPAPVEDPELALRGSFNDWGYDPAYVFTKQESGSYLLMIDELPAGQYKIANEDWSVVYTTSVQGMQIGEYYPLDPDNVSNMSFDSAYTNVIMMFNVEQNYFTFFGEPVAAVEDPELALRGAFCGWAYEPEYVFEKLESGSYMLMADRIEAGEFKIANADWSVEYTTGVTNMKIGEYYPFNFESKDNMGFDTTYTQVIMMFNLTDNYFTFFGEVETGVAVNEIADGKARYFNLQGQEVANPSKGVYIRVVNGKSEKITVR